MQTIINNSLKIFYLIFAIVLFSYGRASAQNIHLGNSSGNIINNGLIAADNERIYYTILDSTHGLYSMKPDGTDIKLLSEDYTEHINTLNGWLYYRKIGSGYKPGGLYKMRTDGTEEQRLAEGMPFYINVVNDWIYYVDEAAGNICKIKTDGSHMQRLYSGRYECLTTDGTSLYFGCYLDSVFKASIDGKRISKILTGNIEQPFISGEWLYYKIDYSKICRINKETLKIEILISDKNLDAEHMVLHNDEIYMAGVFGITKYNLKEKKRYNLYKGNVNELGLAAGYIYFRTTTWDDKNEGHDELHLMKLKDLILLQQR